MSETVNEELSALQSAADQARARYDHEAAVRLYTQAIERARAESAAQALVGELLMRRARAYAHLDRTAEQEADLVEARRLAEAEGDQRRLAQALIEQIYPAALQSRHAEAQVLAEQALALARTLDQPELEARALVWQSMAQAQRGDLRAAFATAQQSLELSREIGFRWGEAYSLGRVASGTAAQGQPAAAWEMITQAVAIARELGDRELEGQAIFVQSRLAADLAQNRNYGEQALAIFHALHDLRFQARSYNNLSLVYGVLGLSDKARRYAERAVAMARRSNANLALVIYLDTLGRAELDQPARARAVYAETLARSQPGDLAIGYAHAGLGRIALAEGRLAEARVELETARAELAARDVPADTAAMNAWLALASLAEGDWTSADRLSAAALDQWQAALARSAEFPPQDVYWCRWQVLRHPAAPPEAAAQLGPLLDAARQLVLAGIATLSDAGLRRNYLNKVRVNRELLLAWEAFQAQPRPRRRARQGAARKTAAKKTARKTARAKAAPAANLQEQLQRLLDLGVRLNEHSHLATLPGFVADELVELTGAERVALVLLNPDGSRRLAESRGFEISGLPVPGSENSDSPFPGREGGGGVRSDDQTPAVLEILRHWLDAAEAARLPLLRQDMAVASQPFSPFP